MSRWITYTEIKTGKSCQAIECNDDPDLVSVVSSGLEDFAVSRNGYGGVALTREHSTDTLFEDYFSLSKGTWIVKGFGESGLGFLRPEDFKKMFCPKLSGDWNPWAPMMEWCNQ